eukprot:3117639-Rhodomonas_salina.3
MLEQRNRNRLRWHEKGDPRSCPLEHRARTLPAFQLVTLPPSLSLPLRFLSPSLFLSRVAEVRSSAQRCLRAVRSRCVRTTISHLSADDR